MRSLCLFLNICQILSISMSKKINLFRMRRSMKFEKNRKTNGNMVCIWVKIGTLAPPLNSIHHFDNNGHPIYLPPWMSDWLNLNVMVPMIAMIVIIVGILVICIALTRRRVDMRNGQKDVYCRFNWIYSTDF